MSESNEAAFQLCDDDGIVRSGLFYERVGKEFPCTGDAHFGGMVIRCTSPAHKRTYRCTCWWDDPCFGCKYLAPEGWKAA